jgi:hypothetical protein
MYPQKPRYNTYVTSLYLKSAKNLRISNLPLSTTHNRNHDSQSTDILQGIFYLEVDTINQNNFIWKPSTNVRVTYILRCKLYVYFKYTYIRNIKHFFYKIHCRYKQYDLTLSLKITGTIIHPQTILWFDITDDGHKDRKFGTQYSKQMLELWLTVHTFIFSLYASQRAAQTKLYSFFYS